MIISIKSDIRSITKNLDALVKKQVPFAQAQALTAIAKRVSLVEKKNLQQVFPTVTPFNLDSIGSTAARPDRPMALVYVKDIAAQYLKPFEDGGKHDLGTKKGLLTPIAQAVNQYGNLPAHVLAQLKGRPDVFIGPVQTSKGTVNGVWQRVVNPSKVTVLKTDNKGNLKRTRSGKATKAKVNTTSLKLLIRFSDPKTVTQRLGWHAMAHGCVQARWRREFDTALKSAMGSAK
jgi:hypothetical protein